MTIDELEAEALKLSAADRAELVRRLLASLGMEQAEEEDPIYGLGRSPVSTGVVDGSTNLDRYLYGDLSR